ncbi:MAG: hypothetical protein LBM98_01320 [Oscillospiraceae bacterium]|nr:hypothetical protein [Oscillospiraceae bacterium]
MRYVPMKSAKQSSAGSHRHVSVAYTTGLLRAYTSCVSPASRRFAMTNS